MRPGELRDLTRRFTDLVERGSGSPDEDEKRLAVLCDLLGLAAHSGRERAEPADPVAIPAAGRGRTRGLAAARFPRLGLYNTAARTSVEIGDGEIVVGDATDDVADIADELAAVSWRLENTGEPDAMWHFFDGYDHHWGAHLRRLQLYLYSIDRGL